MNEAIRHHYHDTVKLLLTKAVDRFHVVDWAICETNLARFC
jgi:hypothetical protein